MLDWLIGLAGLSGVTLGVGAWFLGLPAFLGIVNSLLQVVTPFLKGASEFLVYFIKELWSGFKDMADNMSSIMFVLTVAGIAGLYGYSYVKDCEVTEPTKTVTNSPAPITPKWDPFGQR